MSDLATLRRKRGSVRTSLTAFTKYLDTTLKKERLSETQIIELNDRLKQIQNLLSEFDDIQNEIETICENDSLEQEQAEREIFLEKFYSATSQAKVLSRKYDDSFSENGVNSAGQRTSTIKSSIRLPELSLPKFNGNFENWLEFRDIFESLIHNSTALTDTQKFFYLRGALEGNAAASIKQVQCNAANYAAAWETLCKRFDNVKKLLHDHLGALFSLEAIQKASADKLQQLADNIAKHLGAIQQLGQSTENWDCILIFWVCQKLDNSSLYEWERQTRQDGEPVSLDKFLNFLRERANFVDTLDFKFNQARDKSSNKASASNAPRTPKRETSRVLVSGHYNCTFCKGQHSIYTCEKFLNLSIRERNQFVEKTPSICPNCLREGHKAPECKLGSCKKCKAKHNTLLHAGVSQPPAQGQPQATNSTVMNSGAAGKAGLQVLLPTANILALDQHNNYQQIRALLDCGSQTSFISERAARRLGLPQEKANLSIFGILNTKSQVNRKCNVAIKSAHSHFTANVACYVLPTISNIMPGVEVDINHFEIPSNLKLADPQFNVPGPIEMLIGADLFWRLLKPNKMTVNKHSPTLQNTELGWVVTGQVGTKEPKEASCNLSINQELLQVVSKFWELEEISTTQVLSQKELQCERMFEQTTIRQPNGHFMVSMPFNLSPEELGESRSQAENRFYALERRLSKNKSLQAQYRDFIKEYETSGHMSIVDQESEPKCHYYMPHHGVQKESSLTTKLRVVFDASAPTSNGLSLNNIQLIGPVLQDDLLSIILRFRQYAYVLAADIAKMYRQVQINPEHRPLQRIVWRENPSEPLKTYQLNTVTYGQASASFLAIRCLFQLANEIENEKPNIARIIKHDFYVDDMLTGADSLQEAQRICCEVSDVLKTGCFELRKWCSNNPEVLSGTDRSNLDYAVLEFYTEDKTQTLGLTWSCQNDRLQYNISMGPTEQRVTKRLILATTAKIFDPLGLLSPCIILAKILIQRLWSERISWDEPLPINLESDWINFRNEIPALNRLSINRRVIIQDATETELHGFADSSERAYGACIYLRSTNNKGVVQTSLLCAKSKVAPLKTISVPRLELCGALLLARLVERVTKSFTIELKDQILWSDSTIVLAWIKTSPNLLKTFTANRVSEIQSLTAKCQWRHVSSHENPADIVSRGLYPEQILNATLWWNGPTWLASHETNWPKEQYHTNIIPELKTQTFLVRENLDVPDFPFTRFSRLSRLQRVTAYILRFKDNCSRPIEERSTGVLTIQELTRSIKALIKVCQYQSFAIEIDRLKTGHSQGQKSKLSGLAPFLDESEVLRVGGRLKYSNYEFNKKHPILMDGRHHLTKLLLQNEHLKLLHAGPQMLLNTIRDTYWPLGGRNLARATVRKCLRCFRFKAESYQPTMGNLPDARVSPSSPFCVVGVDYAGPFLIKDRKGRGCKITKCYISLFICFATRAIHLELVSSLSSEAFIQTLCRFIARRGRPSKIFSDNGTNFVGAQRELTRFFKSDSVLNKVQTYTASESIEWHFIPPYSPHFGGLWEAGVKSAKHHLKRVASSTPLLFEEFYTLCVQVEAILNSRPISPLSSDPNDMHPLTPSHFLIGKPMTAVPYEDVTDVKTNRLNRYQLIQQMIQHFWRRWQQEYLSELQRRVRWKHSGRQAAEGDLVLLKEDGTQPTQWRLGRIVALHPGPDGISRVASIRTSSGTTRRGFPKLCPLPMND